MKNNNSVRNKMPVKKPEYIRAKPVFGYPKEGELFCRPKDTSARLRLDMTNDIVVFNFYWPNTGMSFDFRIEGKRQVKAFVDFVARAYKEAKW